MWVGARDHIVNNIDRARLAAPRERRTCGIAVYGGILARHSKSVFDRGGGGPREPPTLLLWVRFSLPPANGPPDGFFIAFYPTGCPSLHLLEERVQEQITRVIVDPTGHTRGACASPSSSTFVELIKKLERAP